VTKVAGVEATCEHALEALADALARAARRAGQRSQLQRSIATRRVTLDGLGALFKALIPEHAIVIDEAVTSGRTFTGATLGARPHDWLEHHGRIDRCGLAAAVGAAIARRSARSSALEGDGSALYTQQALWTMDPRKSRCHRRHIRATVPTRPAGRLTNVGAAAAHNATAMLTLGPAGTSTGCRLAKGFGVDAGRATTLE